MEQRTPHWPFKAKDIEKLAPPGPLAENLDLAQCVKAMRHFMTVRTPEGFFHSAWRHVEYALNQNSGVDDTIRAKYINDASWLIGEIAFNPNTHESTVVNALTLNAYLPILYKRACRQEITSEDCTHLYESLGAVMRMTAPASRENSHSHLAELIPLSVAARTGQPELLLYPTSPREEASIWNEENHDQYFIKANSKVRLQQKLIPCSKTYDASIRILTLLPLIESALYRAGMEINPDPVENIEAVVAAIIAETSGETIYRHETILLNLLSRSMAARLRYTGEYPNAS